MELLRQVWRWVVEAEAWEWIFSGVGVPIAGWLFCRFRNKPPAPQDITPPGGSTISNTFTNSGSGEQNIGQGKDAVAKQVNVSQHISGNGNIVSGTGDVEVKR